MERSRAGVWFQQIRGPFLILSVALVSIGLAAAEVQGSVNGFHAGLLAAGVILAHIAVNLFNEISDFKTGIDSATVRTPFSGGSGMIQKEQTDPRDVRRVAWATLLLAGVIGLYFTWIRGWPVLVLMAAGGLAILFYTAYLARITMGEAVAGLTMGSMVVAGVYFVLTGVLTWDIVLLSIPPGILTALLLFLNEFPDVEADRTGGRKHLVIRLGPVAGARSYALGVLLVYMIILTAPWISRLPYTIYISFLTLPAAVAAVRGTLKNHSDIANLIPAMGWNVVMVIGTDLLLAAGLII
jgi:1,4-dihydroxy-2-naphthoate octaprenyltransferase